MRALRSIDLTDLSYSCLWSRDSFDDVLTDNGERPVENVFDGSLQPCTRAYSRVSNVGKKQCKSLHTKQMTNFSKDVQPEFHVKLDPLEIALREFFPPLVRDEECGEDCNQKKRRS